MRANHPPEIENPEHLCLVRHLAALQMRISAQVTTLMQAEADARARAEAAESACRAMERALIRERARAVLAATRWAWGWGGPPPQTAATSTGADAPAVTSAADVLCQTACQGHAHPWLDSDGSCRLTGGDCTRLAAPALK